MTVAIEPPELETCVAILMSKAHAAAAHLPEEVAFFIAKRIRSNVHYEPYCLPSPRAGASRASPP